MADFSGGLPVVEFGGTTDEGEERVIHPQRRSFDDDLSEEPFDWATLGYTRPACE
jgi:hypothetical protein